MGLTLLHIACLEGQADVAEALLEAGAMVMNIIILLYALI